MCDKIHQSHSNGKRSNKGKGVFFFNTFRNKLGGVIKTRPLNKLSN